MTVELQKLEKEFESEVLDVYRRAKSEANFMSPTLLKMLGDHGAAGAVKQLLHAPAVSEGYVRLWEAGKINLTVEAIIIDNPKWHPLFTEEELKIATKRLKEYNYQKK